MVGSGKGRLSVKQVRILALVWIAVVVLVSVCVFLGILWALNAQGEEAAAEPEQTIAPQSDLPTPITTQPSASTPGGSTPGAVQPTIPPRQDTSFGYGIQAQLMWNTEQTVDQIKQLGLGWVKHQIRWAELEPTPGEINWGAVDYIFETTSKKNVKVLASIVDAPGWARSVTAEGKYGPPDDVQHFVNFISQLLQRYPGAIHAVEVWNEQNWSREWYTAGGLSATSYVELLIPVSQAIHQIDPGIIVISGGMTPTGVNDGVEAIDDFQYLEQMIRAGVLDHVDCVGAHANGFNLPPDVSAEDAYTGGAPTGTVFMGPYDTGNPLNPHHSWSFYSTLTGYHDMIVAAGRNTPLCVTEFGWASVEGLDGEAKPTYEFAYDNTLEIQAQNIVRAFQLMHDWGFVRLAFLFNLDYSTKSGKGPQEDDSVMFSILTPIGAPRPAFEALRDMPKTP